MMPDIEIYDTTLRDGTQGEGVTFSVADKLRIAERLDAFGVHYIEGGWPGSNPKDIEFFEQAKHRTFHRARLAAFGSTRRKDIAASDDDQVRLLIDADTPVVTIFGKTWLLHVREVLQTTPEENLAMIADTVRFLKAHGKFVVYDAEHAFDGCKDDRAYALGHVAGRRARRRRRRRAVRHQRRIAACRDRRDHRATRARSLRGRARHPHARRHRPRRRQRAGRDRRRRHARAGDDQRLRRAHRQLQPDERDADPAVQAEEVVGAGRIAGAAARSSRSSSTRRRTSGRTRACRGSARRRSRTRAGRTSTRCRR